MKKLINLKGVKVISKRDQKSILGGGDLIEFGDPAGGHCAQLGELCASTITCCLSPFEGCRYVSGQSFGYCIETPVI